MKFSIVMPVLNGAAYLEAAIRSVMAQSFADWELIVVDGGSTDETPDTVRRLGTMDDRIIWAVQSGSGMYPAILEGFDRATGDVFGWLNSDDLYPSWSLSTVAGFMGAQTGREWVTGYPAVWDRNGGLRYLLPTAVWPQSWIRKGYFHPELLGCIQAESTFFTRSLWESLTPRDRSEIANMTLAGDYLIWRKFADRAPLHSLPSVVGGFRNHGGNRSIDGISRYMDEVYATGVRKWPPRIARRLGRVFGLYSAARAHRAGLDAGSILNLDNR